MFDKIEKIKAIYNNLTPSEKKIATYILEYPL
ncbi:MAG TPA: RpiR family transcriptional regulator, partial [Thermoanaerobacterales bacterium]|nr:RpiR family transcriptional regulator [Thermoanaerobacterales bacterium]